MKNPEIQGQGHKVWGIPRKVMLMCLAIIIGVGLYFVIYVPYTRHVKQARADRDAKASGGKLVAALERFFNECKDAGCPTPPPWFEDYHLMFLKGPYYGWRAGASGYPVRFRLQDGEVRVCAQDGTAPKGGRTRWIYRYDMLTGQELPPMIGECTGQSLAGDLCFTESILDPLDCSFRFGSKRDPAWAAECEGLIRDASKQLPQQRILATKGINAMGVDLYPKLGDSKSNEVFSPFGLYEQLALFYGGAGGATKRELAGLLHVRDVGIPLHDAIGSLRRVLSCEATRSGGTLEIQTTLKVGSLERLSQDFCNLAERAYDVRIDGSSIQQVSPYEFPMNTVNLIVFRNKWQDKFSESGTVESPFFLLDGKQINVPTMSQTEGKPFSYMERKHFETLEMRYDSGTLSMVVFLPKKRDGLLEFERTVTNEKLQQWLADLEPWEWGVTVYMPKFTPHAFHNLKDLLVDHGLISAFDRERADFAKMVRKPLDDRVYMVDEQQQVEMEVDEQGSQIITATINCSRITALDRPSDDYPKRKKGQPIVFRIDHPFMFIVRHIPSNCILIMGRVTNPLK